jgi:hypothetical protein
MKIVTYVDAVAEPLGWDISRLSRRADLGYGTVYNIWKHNTTSPDLLTLAKIAYVLRVPMETLYAVVLNDPEEKQEIVDLIKPPIERRTESKTPELVES